MRAILRAYRKTWTGLANLLRSKVLLPLIVSQVSAGNSTCKLNQLVDLQVPKLCCTIVTTCNKPAPIWAYRQCIDRVGSAVRVPTFVSSKHDWVRGWVE